MGITVTLESGQLTDLQQHMANLVRYYESDLTALGLLGDCPSTAGAAYAKELMHDRLEQLSSADHLWSLLAQY